MKKYHRVDCPKGFNGYEKRRPIYCKTRNEASDLRARIKLWKATRRMPDLQWIEIIAEDRNWLGYLKNRIGDLARLPAIIDRWEHTGTQHVRTPMIVPHLVQAFLEYRSGRRGANQRTLANLRYCTRAFRDKFAGHFVHELTSQDLRSFLDSLPSQTVARNTYRVLRVLFNYAIEQGVLIESPLAKIKSPVVKQLAPAILTPDDLVKLLRTAQEHFSELVPYLTIAAFAGLRSKELVALYDGEATLQWPDVLFDRGLILVREEVAKTTRSRHSDRRFPPLEPVLAEWLRPYAKESGPVVELSDASLRYQMSLLSKAAGVKIPQNALRHSFGSYWLARTGVEGVGRLAVIMGNSEAVARSHYVASLMPSEGAAWFGVTR